MNRSSSPEPKAIELLLPWGPTLRGMRWEGGSDRVLLFHEPGADIDGWGALPGELARTLALEVIAVDLPGHGLSDDPWEPARILDLIRCLAESGLSKGERFVIAAGRIAFSTLTIAADLDLAGVVCLSPEASDEALKVARSPKVPKLMIAGSLAGEDLDTARRFASDAGGWAIVTSIPVAERGTALLASEWRGRLVEQITTFLRDCQHRSPPLRGAMPPPHGTSTPD